MRGIGMIAGQADIARDAAYIGTQMLGLCGRNPVPDMKVCIAQTFFHILRIVQNIRCHLFHSRAVFADQFCNCLFRALKEQTYDFVILQTYHILSVTPIQYGFAGKYLMNFEIFYHKEENA